MKIVGKVNWLKSSYGDVISTLNDMFYQWDTSTAIPMEEVCEP